MFCGVLKKSDTEIVEVAVKRLKGCMAKKRHSEFIKEAKMMRR